MTTNCVDVCSDVVNYLVEAGCNIDPDDENHDDVLKALENVVIVRKPAKITARIQCGVMQAFEGLPEGFVLEVIDDDMEQTWRYENVAGKVVETNIDYEERIATGQGWLPEVK